MTPALLLAAGLLAASPPESPASPPTPTVRAAYEAVRQNTGPDAAAQVRLALWCEAHGLPAERLKHLALAALRDPKDAAARGLMGVVRFGDQWARPDKVAGLVASDADYHARIAEYHKRRDQAAPTADGQARLAQWCEENGLADESRAHHSIVLRLEPNRELSRRKLGYKKDGKRWVTDEQLAAEKEDSRQQKEADRRWKASLSEWRGWLDDRGDRRERAASGLAGVTDPRAVPSVLAVFGRGNSADRGRAVRLLGQIDAAASSRALARLAVFDELAEIRRAAIETLKRRDPREFAGLLVALLRDPIRYEVRPVGGPGSPGTLFVGGKRFNVQRIYETPSAPFVPFDPSTRMWLDGQGLPVVERTISLTATDRIEARVGEAQAIEIARAVDPASPPVPDILARISPGIVSLGRRNATAGHQASSPFEPQIHSEVKISYDGKVNVHRRTIQEISEEIPIGLMMVEAQQNAGIAQQTLENDVAMLEAQNREIRESNERVDGVLDAVAERDLPAEPEAWKSWWIDTLGFRTGLDAQSAYIPTVVEDVPLGFVPQSTPWVNAPFSFTMISGFKAVSCFGAGTPVSTLDGPRPIEFLKVGDRVLTQSVRDGSLGYAPITQVHHNPPSPTFLVKLGGDTIVSSPFHRFWVAGRGWVMARDLEGHETLRLLGGTRRVDAVEAGPVQPVFNLDVAGDHDFFAGGVAALVHDNSLPDTRLVPFDATPTTLEAKVK